MRGNFSIEKDWVDNQSLRIFFYLYKKIVHLKVIIMGKGDRKTKRGKIIKGSYGVTRPKKKRNVMPEVEPKPAKKKAAPKATAKPKAAAPKAAEKDTKKAAPKKTTSKAAEPKAEVKKEEVKKEEEKKED